MRYFSITLAAALLLSFSTQSAHAGSWPIDCKDKTTGFSLSLNHYTKSGKTDYAVVPTAVYMSVKKVLIKFLKAKKKGALVWLSFEKFTVVYSGTKTAEATKHAVLYDDKGNFVAMAKCTN